MTGSQFFGRLRPTAIFTLFAMTCLGPALHADTLPAPTAQPSSSAPEYRAFWVDGFNDGFITPAQCDTLLDRVRAAHCNAIFVQMRKRGDAYYASHYEPWANDDPEHFDALDYLCREAHMSGMPYIQVHAWINTCAVGGSRNPRGVAALHPEWYSISDTGATFDGESTKIDPGIPDAADWTYRVVLDVVRHYPVDGVHLDFIRYGGDGKTVGHWGYSPVAVSRYEKALAPSLSTPPSYDDPAWKEWRRDQVTALVRRVYLSAIALRPKIIVSAATICWGDGPVDDAAYFKNSAAYDSVFADWRGWMAEGILDLNCPMTYVNMERHPDFWAHWAAFVKDHQFGRLATMGIGAWENGIDGSIRQITDTRAPTEAGNRAAGAVIFSYAGTDTVAHAERQYDNDFYQALATPDVFGADVPAPSMPWKDRPSMGYVDGYALAPDLTPVDGAMVALTSHADHSVTRTTADGNGFFGFANVTPGVYDLTTKPLQSQPSTSGIVVVAGQVTQVAPLVDHVPVAGTGNLADGASVTYVGAVVTVGSDRLGSYFFVADGFGKPSLRVYAPNLTIPTIPGDVVAITGTVRHIGTSPPTVEATAVRNLGAVLIVSPDR